ncbi:MAG: hypothetical protein JRD89_09325 [Deltaproteobacteria bacterium]|nr:hypothetical protein [Deltaproteobacteria bacterium]
MKALLIQVDDTPFPNRALRCWGGYLKEKGHEVFYNSGCSDPDIVKISCVFEWNAPKARGIAQLWRALGAHVELGGYGVDKHARLPEEVEHHMPDYEGIDFSFGFTTRGCIRRCEFCDVWRIEGGFREHAPIEEFWDPAHDKIVFLDNIFNASKLMGEKLRFCKEHELKVSVTQGFDARLITKEQARIIADHWPYYNWKFNDTALYTAWDRMEDEDLVLRGIKNLIEAGIPARKIIPYVLVSYNTSFDQDMYRFRKLRELGVYPFVMPYNNKPHPMRRWGQRPALFKTVPFEEYHAT